jgi:hypothetical protein
VDGRDIPVAIALFKLAAQDPQKQLDRLRALTSVREQGSASGSGWTGHRYTFSLGVRDPKQGPPVSGTIDIDGQGRIRRLHLTMDGSAQSVVKGRTAVEHSDMEFGGFGTPVHVTAPPADQVVDISLLPDQSPGKPSPKPGAGQK